MSTYCISKAKLLIQCGDINLFRKGDFFRQPSASLQEIELKTGEAEQAADAARKEVTELQYAVTALSEDRDRLTKEIEGVKEDRTLPFK